VRDEQIIALPTLVKQLPLPLRRIVGDLSDDDRVVLGLGLTLDEPDNDLEKPDDD
jgi:circadian clock protein KaiB